MDLFFKILRLLKGVFVKKSIVYLNENGEQFTVRKKYIVKIKTDINSIDNEIIYRYYEVVGLTNQKYVKSLWDKDEKQNINIICEHIRDAIELDSNIKIDMNKLYKAVQIKYSGKLLVDDVSIKFEQC